MKICTIILLLVLSACGTRPQAKHDFIKNEAQINFEEIKGKANNSETKPQEVEQEIKKIIFWDDFFVILSFIHSSATVMNYSNKFIQKLNIKGRIKEDELNKKNFNNFCQFISNNKKYFNESYFINFESVINPLNQPFLMRKLELNKKYNVCYVRNPFEIKEKRVEIESDIFNESEKAELKIILESFSLTTDGSIFISLVPYIALKPDPNEELFLRLICALGNSKALIHFYLISTDERKIHTVINEISFEDSVL